VWTSRPVGRVPHLHGLVLGGGGQARAVGAEGHGEDGVGVPGQGEALAAGVRVPQLHGSIEAAAGDECAVATEGHAANAVGVAAKREAAGGATAIEQVPLEAARVGLPEEKRSRESFRLSACPKRLPTPFLSWALVSSPHMIPHLDRLSLRTRSKCTFTSLVSNQCSKESKKAFCW
jgi:hypothetical protein